MLPRHDTDTAGSIFLVILTGLALYLAYLMLRPLLGTILLAAFLAILAQPLYRRLLRLFKARRAPSALLSCVVICFIIIIPMVVLLTLLASETLILYGRAAAFVQGGGIQQLLNGPAVATLKGLAERYLHLELLGDFDIKTRLLQQLQSLAGYFIALGQRIAANFAMAVLHFGILVFTLFYFFVNGETLVGYLVRVSPLPESRSRTLLKRFEDVTHAAFYGNFGVAAAQGFLGGAALAMVGYQGIFWGLVMALLSLIPMVGAAMIWVPAGVILLLGGRWIAGFGVLAWGVLVVSTVDNFLRPYLMEGRSGLHPAIILLSVVGGLRFFGILGIIFGPLVAAVGLALLDMFSQEYGTVRLTG